MMSAMSRWGEIAPVGAPEMPCPPRWRRGAQTGLRYHRSAARRHGQSIQIQTRGVVRISIKVAYHNSRNCMPQYKPLFDKFKECGDADGARRAASQLLKLRRQLTREL